MLETDDGVRVVNARFGALLLTVVQGLACDSRQEAATDPRWVHAVFEEKAGYSTVLSINTDGSYCIWNGRPSKDRRFKSCSTTSCAANGMSWQAGMLANDERTILERISAPQAREGYGRDNHYRLGGRRFEETPQVVGARVLVQVSSPAGPPTRRDPDRFYAVDKPFDGVLFEGWSKNGAVTTELLQVLRGIEARHRAMQWCPPRVDAPR